MRAIPLRRKAFRWSTPSRSRLKEALKGTPPEGAKIYLAGTAATWDMHDGAQYDLLIAAIAAVALIFVIMLLITRALVAARGDRGHRPAVAGERRWVCRSCCGSTSSGLELHWMVIPMAVILLLAVGSGLQKSVAGPRFGTNCPVA